MEAYHISRVKLHAKFVCLQVHTKCELTLCYHLKMDCSVRLDQTPNSGNPQWCLVACSHIHLVVVRIPEPHKSIAFMNVFFFIKKVSSRPLYKKIGLKLQKPFKINLYIGTLMYECFVCLSASSISRSVIVSLGFWLNGENHFWVIHQYNNHGK